MRPIGVWRFYSYLVRHKWFVFQGCWAARIPWLGILHDLSKFRPSECFAYMAFLSHSPLAVLTLDARTQAIKKSMWLHAKRNKHHWQWWVMPYAPGGMKAFPMERKYIHEMVADWRGAGRVQGRPDTTAWYRANRSRMELHPETRRVVEELLGLEAKEWNP